MSTSGYTKAGADLAIAAATAAEVARANGAYQGKGATPGLVASSGEYQFSDGFQSGAAGTLVRNTLNAAPFSVPVSKTYDNFAYNVSVASAGGAGVGLRVGIYLDGGATGLPGALLADLGLQSLAVTGVVLASMSSVGALAAGRYWLACVFQYTTVPTTSPQVNLLSGNISPSLPGPAFGTNYRGRALTGVAGALPNPFSAGSVAVTNSVPQMALRAL